jgi:hypothetical protein
MADVIACLLTVPGCLGCYALWPVALFVPVVLLLALLSSGKSAGGPDWRLIRRAGVTGLLFVLTWYECATVKRQALHGFAERVESRVSEEQLFAWVGAVIAAEKKRPLAVAAVVGLGSSPGQGGLIALPALSAGGIQAERPRHLPPGMLTRDEIPTFIHDLIGHFPETTRVEVRLDRGDPYVAVFNSSLEAFRITVRPSRRPHERSPFPPRWLIQELDGLQWRPGIFFDTAGNFR